VSFLIFGLFWMQADHAPWQWKAAFMLAVLGEEVGPWLVKRLRS
jgi:hypothetical protein